jgi:hypothetical protein
VREGLKVLGPRVGSTAGQRGSRSNKPCVALWSEWVSRGALPFGHVSTKLCLVAGIRCPYANNLVSRKSRQHIGVLTGMMGDTLFAKSIKEKCISSKVKLMIGNINSLQ